MQSLVALFAIPNCPNCGQPVNHGDLRREFWRRGNFDDKPHGIECPTCHQVLKLSKWRSNVLAVVLYAALPISAVFFPGQWQHLDRESTQFVAVLILILVGIVYMRWAPLLARLVRPAPGEKVMVDKPLEVMLAEDPEYQRDMQELDELNEWRERANSPNRREWRCAECGEENPANFDICWKCQKPNPRQSASESSDASDSS